MILVTGATGYVGRAVVTRLASLGRDVGAVVRNAKTASRILPPEISIHIANYEDTSALKRAFNGAGDVVVISSDGEANAVMRHHANAIEAAAAAKVGRIIFTSIVDIDASSPFYFSPVYRDAERRLVQCPVPSTILRCGLYADFILKNWLAPSQMSGELVLPTGHSRVAPISRDNVAAAVAEIAANPAGSRDVYTLTGHRALDFCEIAALYGEVITRQPRYRPCSAQEYLTWASANLGYPWPEAFSTLCASIVEDRYSQVSKDFKAITGHHPESFRDFLLRTVLHGPPD
jgi:NAD(P)H dehydrogenase (quinone)